MKSALSLAIALLILVSGTTAQESIKLRSGTTLNVRTINSVAVQPWQLAVEPNGTLWCTDRDNGRVLRIHPGLGWTDIMLDLPLTVSSDNPEVKGGLYGIAIHPQFDAGTPYVFITYTSADDKLTVARYTFESDRLVRGKVLLSVDNVPHTLGNTLTVLHDNTLLISIGSFDTPAPTELHSLNGKLIRITLDGKAATDNPWYNSEKPLDAAGFIYSYGHRNASGVIQLPLTHNSLAGAIFSVESGALANDEINLIQPGKHFGWRVTSGFCESNSINVECPKATYYQAPSQLAYYGSSAIPEWKNSLLVSTMYGNGLMVAELGDNASVRNSDRDATPENTMQLDGDHLIPFSYDSYMERLRSVAVSFDGRVYLIGQRDDEIQSTRIIAIENPAAHSPMSVDEEIVTGAGFSFGPNPASNLVTLQLNTVMTGIWDLQLVDVMGRTVYQEQHEQTELGTTFNVSSLSTGAYMIVITSQNAKLRSMLMK